MKKQDVLPQKPTSWHVHGRTWTVGDAVTVVAPELGVLQTAVAPASYNDGGSGRLCLGWVKTPLDCIPGTADGLHNAVLGYSYIGENHAELHLVYFCNCRNNAHPYELRWRDVRLADGVIRSRETGICYGRFNDHPLVAGYEHLVVERPLPVEKPEPAPPPGSQLGIFEK